MCVDLGAIPRIPADWDPQIENEHGKYLGGGGYICELAVDSPSGRYYNLSRRYAEKDAREKEGEKIAEVQRMQGTRL